VKVPFARRRELGQNFLVDENIVAVAGRLADLHTGDVVLEVGPGLGVLTAYLADRVRFVHAIEVDSTLAPHLYQRFGARGNVKLVFEDALKHLLGELEPPPNKFVSNLPYNVATPLVVESLDGIPTVERWCVMVQREVADRFFAPPRTKSYGAVSVLVQLTAARMGFHPVSRTVFRPQPNVDSALVAFRRRRSWGDEFAPLKEVVQAAFAHRRKRLGNSLEFSGFERGRVDEALAELGLPVGARAEQLRPEQFERLAECLA
jgi:16S rRNA (adenine1518-N6/adenine1519-N6)-dimethyltransferase